MIPHCGGMKTNSVHQSRHGIGGLLIHIVIGIACTIIASRQNQQSRLDATQTIHDRRKFRELINRSVHVIDRKNRDLLLLCQTGQTPTKEPDQHEILFFHTGN